MGSFVKVCKKVNDGMLSAETVILGIITAFLVACIFIEVVCRYFFFISVPWARNKMETPASNLIKMQAPEVP